MATSPTTFPGFYASVIDKSFAPVTLSRFRGGLTGVANKGPFNTPTLVNSLTEFANKFGDSNVTNDAGWAGQLAVTAASVADFSGSSLIVRIGHQYESTGVVDNASGAASGTSTITVTNANHFTVGDYIRIIDAQGEVETTSNAVISNVNVGADTITIDTPLQYTYANGSTIYRSSQSGAATSAEAFLSAFTFVTNRVGSGSSATVSGTKGEFTLECTADLSKKTITAISASGGTVTATTSSAHNYAVGDQIKIENVVASSGNGVFNGTYTLLTASGSTFTYASLTSFSDTGISATVGGVMTAAALSAGDLIKISNSTNPTVGLATDTGEVLVKSVVANNTTGGCTITLYPSGVTSLGYQSLPLQANYTTARIYKVKRADGLDSGGAFDTYRILHLWASSEGTWANSDSATNSNLVVGIGPGSAAGSKKLLVFYNTELVETIDNLTYLDSTADTFFPTKVNATSAYVRVGYDGIADEFLVNDVPPANTLDGWNITNLGGKTNVANFTGGDNGANTENSDWVGDLNPTTDLYTGFQSFRNETDYQVNVLAIPGATDTDLQQNLVQVARVLNAVAILDVAETTVPRQYADWRNAAGQFTNRTKIDDCMGVAIEKYVSIHKVVEGIERGIYRKVDITPTYEDTDLEPTQEVSQYQDEKVLLLTYYGLVPREYLNNLEENKDIVELFPDNSYAEDYTDMVEAIVVIANDGLLLKAEENPYMMKDRPVLSYQDDTVPNRLLGRGTVEKAFNMQKAIDAQTRSHLDSLALTTSPMIAMDATRLPRGMKFEIKPGKAILTNGAPSEILYPFKFGQSDPNNLATAKEFERMLLQATGTLDSQGLVSQSSRDGGGMSMAVASIIKKYKRTLVNFQEDFLIPFIKKEK